MERRTITERLHWLLAALLIGLLMWEGGAASSRKSAVFDEPPHIAAGLSYLETGVFQANLQHPPLLKELSALSLHFAGIHWPKTLDAVRVLNGGPEGADAEWTVGADIIAKNGPDRTLFWARLPFILLAGLLGGLIYLWGRALVGPWAALGALFLYVLDPTIVAHSFLVTTDVGVTAFSLLFLFLLWRYVQQPSKSALAWCGLSLGAALGAKFTALMLVPIAAVLLFVARSRMNRRRAPNYFLTLFVIALLAAVVVQGLYFFSSDLSLYVTGAQRVNADHDAGFQAYFHGMFAPRFYGYFVWAYLLKEPIATIVLTVAGTVVLARQRSMAVVDKWFLCLAPVVFAAAVTFRADDLGVRYIIPVLPFAFLCGGAALAWLGGKGWVGKGLAAALCVWVAVNGAGIFPDHLSFFNEGACLFESPRMIGWDAGARCGPAWLDDSNVDWGQGLKQLRAWVDANAANREFKLAYFGTFPPENYGLPSAVMTEDDLLTDPPPGLYAISAHAVARFGAMPGGAWMRRLTPIAVVGHAFSIYEIRR